MKRNSHVFSINPLFVAAVTAVAGTACSAQDLSGSDELTQTVFFDAALANCSQTVALGNLTIKKGIELKARVRQNGGQKVAVGIFGSYTELRRNADDPFENDTNVFQFQTSNDSDGLRVIQRTADFVDLSLVGTATEASEGTVTEYFLNGAALEKESIALQLKDDAANVTVITIDCQAPLSNLWLFQPSSSSEISRDDVKTIRQKYAAFLADPSLAALCFEKVSADFIRPALHVRRVNAENGNLGELTGPSIHHEEHIQGEILQVLSGAETDEGIVVHELRDAKLVSVTGGDSETDDVSVIKIRYESLLDDSAAREMRDRVQLVTSEGNKSFERCFLGGARF